MRLPFTRLTSTLGILVACAALAATQSWAQPASMGPLGTPSPAAYEKIQEVADAKTRFRKLDLKGALELLREAVKKNPDRLPPAQIIMAMWYGQANQGAAALGSLERAVVEDPTDPEAYVFLGNAELQAGRVTAAGLVFGKAHTLAQSFTKSPSRKKSFEPRIYAGLAAVSEVRATMAGDDKARAQEEWGKAEGHLNSWLKLDPDSALAMQRLGRALFKQGSIEKDRKKAGEKLKAALQMLKDAKNADPNLLNPFATMAGFYQEADDFKNAKKFMDYALSPKEGSEDLRTRLTAARWCLQTSVTEPDQLDKAQEHASKALVLDDKSLDAQILRGVVALFQKDYTTAERFFLAAHVDAPSNFPASNNLALALCEQDEGKQRRALGFATNNARQFSQGRYATEAASTYGWVLYKNGRVVDADKVLSQLVRSGRVSEDTLYCAARVATERRRPEEAIQLLDRAMKSKNPFSMRPEAKKLLEQLRRKSGGR